jgi:hypothetical protein
MKHLSILCLFGLVAAGCGGGGSSSSSPASPSSSSTSTTTFSVLLSPGAEVPAVTNADASAGGTAAITLHATKDSKGTVTAATADFSLTFTGFPAGTSVDMAHIHPGGSGVNGGPLVTTGIAPGVVKFTNGTGSFSQTGVNVPADTAQAILNNPAGYYFNIHTSLNPNGAARGQLGSGTSTGTDPTPPSTGY